VVIYFEFFIFLGLVVFLHDVGCFRECCVCVIGFVGGNECYVYQCGLMGFSGGIDWMFDDYISRA